MGNLKRMKEKVNNNFKFKFEIQCTNIYLINKREVTLTDFERKIHPPRLLIS